MSTSNKSFIGAAGILIGLLFTVLVSFQLHRVQKYSIDNDFASLAHSLSQSIEREMILNAEGLYSLKALFESSEEVTADEFTHATNDLLFRHSDVLSFEWIPRVAKEDRTGLEQKLRSRDPFVSFTELSSDHSLIKAGERETYYPTVFIEPLNKYSQALGFDHASEPTRADLVDRARDSNSLAFSPKVTSITRHEESPIVLLALPVYRGPVTTLVQRRESFIGLVVARINIAHLFQGALSTFERSIYAYELVDVTDDGQHAILISHGNATGEGKFTETLSTIGGRTWMVKADMGSKYLFSEENLHASTRPDCGDELVWHARVHTHPFEQPTQDHRGRSCGKNQPPRRSQ